MLKNIIDKIIQWKIVLMIQALMSIVFAALLIQLNVLPMMYIAIIIVIEILLGVGIFFLMRNAQKVRLIVSHIISLVISIVLVIGCMAVSQGNSAIHGLTSDHTQTNRISLYVLDDSSYQELSDLKNQSIEANVNDEHMAEAIDALNKEVALSIQGQEDYVQMSNDSILLFYLMKFMKIFMKRQEFYIHMKSQKKLKIFLKM